MKLTPEFISKNPKFNKKEQQLIIKTLLNKISLTTKRSSFVYLKFNKFGTIRTHGNKRKMNRIKHSRRFNKKYWTEDKEVKDNSKEYLLW